MRLLASFLLITICGVTAAAPIDFTRRHVPLQVTATEIRRNDAVAEPPADSRILRTSFEIPSVKDQPLYALLVPLGKVPVIKLNDKIVELDPLERKDGLLFRLPAHLAAIGTNTLIIEAAEPQNWAGTTVFSLDGTSEEVHFGRAFSDAAPRTPPPVDALQSHYDVIFYDCSFEPNMTAANLLSASVTMRGRSLNSSLQTVVLDFNSNGGLMVIDGVDQGPATGALGYVMDSAADKLRVTLPAPVPAGQEFQLRVNYHGAPSTAGRFGAPYRYSTHSGTGVVFTFSEPYAARNWWPCKDLPEDKATSIALHVTVPAGAGWQVVTNGIHHSTTSAAGKETWHWKHGYPISTYLVSLCISNYTYVTAPYTALDGITVMPISHAIYPENVGVEGTAATGTRRVMQFFASKFGEYPFLSEKYYTASHNSGSGMEHQTCTSMPGGDVQDGMQRRNVHELAHHWFGDLITCRTFNDLWLNEGFATYCEALWDEHNLGKAAYHSRVNAWSISFTQPVVGPDSDNFSNSAVYQKGGWVLHMLRHVVGDTAFFELMRQWATHPTYRYSTAVTQDFENLAEAVSGKNLTTFFSQWLTRPAFSGDPIRAQYAVSARHSVGASGNQLTVNVQQRQAGTPFQMPIDMVVTYTDNTSELFIFQNTIGTQSQVFQTGLKIPQRVQMDPDNWVLKAPWPRIETCYLAPATTGAFYSRVLTASGESSPYSWSLASPAPAGMTLSSGGTFSGTPSTPGTYTLSVNVTRNGHTTNGNLTFTVTGTSVEDWQLY